MPRPEPVDLLPRVPTFDPIAFDRAIRSHGVRFVHFRAMRNPHGMVDRFDSRRPGEDHSNASNGMTYTKAGCFTALLVGNSKQLRAMEGGLLHSANAQITPARCYDNTDETIHLHPHDRLFLEEESILVPFQQLVDAHESGHDRLHFPVVKVQDLVDANGVIYKCNKDFKIQEGQIVWTGSNRPGINTKLDIGTVYAVRYLYQPHWYIDRLVHDIRIAQTENSVTGERTTVTMPQSAIMQREYVFINADKDEEAPESPRQEQSPRDGGFGVR